MMNKKVEQLIERGLGVDDGRPYLEYIAMALSSSSPGSQTPSKSVVDAIDELTAAVRELTIAIKNA